MKALYFDCSMGAAGDMLSAALLELVDDKDKTMASLNDLGIPEVEYILEPGDVLGSKMHVVIKGEEEHPEDVSLKNGHCHHTHAHPEHTHVHSEHTHVHSEHAHIHSEHTHAHPTHTHAHHSLNDVLQIVESLKVKDSVKDHIIRIFQLIAEAEAHVHHTTMEHIHFHEVGTMDAIADVAAVCFLMDELHPDMIMASEIHVGSGKVKCAHGILPVPAPATAYLLQGIPIYGGNVEGELCTPTGAAILKYFVGEYGKMPVMKIMKNGYGLGKKEFEILNCVTAYLGEIEEQEIKQEQIVELCCNLDDMTGEEIGFAQEILMDMGALEVYTTAVGMKKSRPGVLFTCLCKKEQKETMAKAMLKYTTTLGIRVMESCRYTLSREQIKKETDYGCIRIKKAGGTDVYKEKIEYEDLRKIAKDRKLTLWEAKKIVEE